MQPVVAEVASDGVVPGVTEHGLADLIGQLDRQRLHRAGLADLVGGNDLDDQAVHRRLEVQRQPVLHRQVAGRIQREGAAGIGRNAVGVNEEGVGEGVVEVDVHRLQGADQRAVDGIFGQRQQVRAIGEGHIRGRLRHQPAQRDHADIVVVEALVDVEGGIDHALLALGQRQVLGEGRQPVARVQSQRRLGQLRVGVEAGDIGITEGAAEGRVDEADREATGGQRDDILHIPDASPRLQRHRSRHRRAGRRIDPRHQGGVGGSDVVPQQHVIAVGQRHHPFGQAAKGGMGDEVVAVRAGRQGQVHPDGVEADERAVLGFGQRHDAAALQGGRQGRHWKIR